MRYTKPQTAAERRIQDFADILELDVTFDANDFSLDDSDTLYTLSCHGQPVGESLLWEDGAYRLLADLFRRKLKEVA